MKKLYNPDKQYKTVSGKPMTNGQWLLEEGYIEECQDPRELPPVEEVEEIEPLDTGFAFYESVYDVSSDGVDIPSLKETELIKKKINELVRTVNKLQKGV